MEQLTTTVAVLGAGPGGYAAAFMAADLGLDVTLIDVEPNPGGTCLYKGCIPSKALLHVAKIINEAHDSADWGIHFQEPLIDFDALRTKKDDAIKQLTGGLGQLCKARRIHYIQGRGSLMDSHTLKVDELSGQETLITFQHCILSPGSRPALLEKFLIDSPRIMTSTNALQITDIPKSLLVIGGGYIGLELGSVYAAFRTKVSVVEMGPTLLPGADEDLVKPLAGRMAGIFSEIMLRTQVVSLKEESDGLHVTLEGPDKQTFVRVYDKVLISIGRKPNASGLGLKSTAVKINEQGFAIVDSQRRTTDPSIFAIGDLAGQPMLAHKASHEGRIAAQVIAGKNVSFEPQAIPAVVFTDPEIAWCGLSETEAKRINRQVKVARFPWGASGRALTIGRTEGMTKIIADPSTDQVLGIGIVGSNAGELIAEGVLAIEMGALAADIQLTIHPHPTLGETIMESAEIIFGNSTHVFKPQKQ